MIVTISIAIVIITLFCAYLITLKKQSEKELSGLLMLIEYFIGDHEHEVNTFRIMSPEHTNHVEGKVHDGRCTYSSKWIDNEPFRKRLIKELNSLGYHSAWKYHHAYGQHLEVTK